MKYDKGENKVEWCVAEIELAYRPNKHHLDVMRDPVEAHMVIRSKYNDDTIQHREFFKVFYLDAGGKVIGYANIAAGGIMNTTVDIRYIFQVALLTNATSIILSHNHPSGKSTPSQEDKQLTQRIVDAGKILQITVKDHIIVTNDDFYSFAEHGYL